ncbi:MAG: alkaline phosphatase [Cyclobacteriaceae bacterium]
MKHLLLTLSVFLAALCCDGQQYSSSAVFAHNDYVREKPFFTAYNLQVGFIEADVFLSDGELLVAHHANEIVRSRTLETLYLKPLAIQIHKNKGLIYADAAKELTLMIDLKTKGTPTLNKLVEQVKGYPDLLACSTLHFLISGDVPPPSEWKNYPFFIYFDGRPNIQYSTEELKRISMISTSFKDHVKWDGPGEIPDEDRKKITAMMAEVHSKGKQMRLWATPDTENAWNELMKLKVDVIVTDDVSKLIAFLNR